jgi:mannose-6-phosphate isomerase-like protein (cupin superfamily)
LKRTTTGASQVEGEAALYALGALRPDEAEKFRQRLGAGCALCREMVEVCEHVVTMLPLSAPEVEPPPHLRTRLLERIGTDLPRPAAASPMGDGLLVRADDTEWMDAPAPGVRYRQLHGARTMLVRMEPDTWLPAHDHKLAEQCLVLEGSIRSDDVTAYAGDYTYMPAGSVHSALYSETGALFLITYS